MPHYLVSAICPFCIHRMKARQSELAVHLRTQVYLLQQISLRVVFRSLSLFHLMYRNRATLMLLSMTPGSGNRAREVC